MSNLVLSFLDTIPTKMTLSQSINKSLIISFLNNIKQEVEIQIKEKNNEE